MIFFTSDTHFGHERTLKLSKRPFETVEEMSIKIVENWNSVVNPSDVVYHLGDFGEKDFINKLNGHIIFLPGNYDTEEDIAHFKEAGCVIIENGHEFDYRKRKYVLIHEPEKGESIYEFYLFGHIHKLQMVKKNGLNVGVDCHNFFPISMDDVIFYRDAIEKHYDHNVFCPYVRSYLKTLY